MGYRRNDAIKRFLVKKKDDPSLSAEIIISDSYFKRFQDIETAQPFLDNLDTFEQIVGFVKEIDGKKIIYCDKCGNEVKVKRTDSLNPQVNLICKVTNRHRRCFTIVQGHIFDRFLSDNGYIT